MHNLFSTSVLAAVASLRWLHHAALVLLLMTAAWWWRHPQLIGRVDERLYFVGFGFFPLVMVAIIVWLLGGASGLGRLLGSWRVVPVLWLAQMALWARISYGDDVINAEVALSAATQWMVVVLLVLTVASHPPPLRWVLRGFALAMLVGAGVGLGQVLLQSDMGVQRLDILGLNLRELPLDPQRSGVSVIGYEDVRYLRPYGLSAHPNLLAGAVVMGIWAAIGLRWRGAALLGLWVLLLSFSRAALGGFVLGGVVFALLTLLRRRDRQAIHWQAGFGWLAAIVGLILLFGVIYQPLITARLGLGGQSEAGFEDFSAASRSVYLGQARLLIPQNRWAGVGIGNFAWESATLLQDDWRDLRGDHVHNIYVLAMAEVGVVGFALWAGAIVSVGLLFLRQWWRGGVSVAERCLASGVAGWLAIGWFDHYLWTQFGFQVGFGIALMMLARASAETARNPLAPPERSPDSSTEPTSAVANAGR